MSTTRLDEVPPGSIAGVTIPNSKLAQEATELVRDTESSLLFNHSTRVYYFGSLAGKRRGLDFDPELLYLGAMFHDIGLTPKYSSKADRFEVDSANTARAFLRDHHISQQEVDLVWTAIALHTTPGIPQYMHPVVALVNAGVEMDVLGIGYSEFAHADREAVVRNYSTNAGLQRGYYSVVLRRDEAQAGNYVRYRECGRPSRQRFPLPTRQLLPCDPRFSVAHVMLVSATRHEPEDISFGRDIFRR